jgi:hypothetical protein
MLERKEKNTEKEREKLMNVELSKRGKDTDKQERRERIKERKIKGTQGVREVYDRGNSGIPGERECKREKNDGEIQMWERGETKQVLDGRREKEVKDVLCGEKETIEHMWNGCSKMRARGRERNGEKY